MIRHVAEQLFWAIVTLRFGRTPNDQDSDYSPSEADVLDPDDHEGLVPGWKADGSDSSDSDISSDECEATPKLGTRILEIMVILITTITMRMLGTMLLTIRTRSVDGSRFIIGIWYIA